MKHNIVRLEVSMHNSILVAVIYSQKDRLDEILGRMLRNPLIIGN
jgi:hypothetical protein